MADGRRRHDDFTNQHRRQSADALLLHGASRQQVGGLGLHLLDWGGEGRTPLLLLHAFTGHAHAWDTLSIALQPHFHVYALDQRGHGDSDPAPAYHAIAAFDDLCGVAEQLALGSFILVGLSMGGRNGMYFASRRPEAVQKLVVLDIGPEISPRAALATGPAEPDTWESIEQAAQHLHQANPYPGIHYYRWVAAHSLRARPDGALVWAWHPSVKERTPWADVDWWAVVGAIAPPNDRHATSVTCRCIMKIRKHLETLPSYTPIEPFEVLSARIGRALSQIVKLDANENPYGILPAVRKALAEMDFPHIYPDPESRALRKSLAEFTGVDEDYPLAGSGADELLDLLMRVFLEPSECILSCPPTFGMYPFDAELNAARCIEVPRNADFSLNMDGIRKAVDEYKPKLLFIASPNNPDGSLIPSDMMDELLALPLLVVLDEAPGCFSHSSIVNQGGSPLTKGQPPSGLSASRL